MSKDNKRDAKLMAKINKYRGITKDEIIEEVGKEFPDKKKDARKIYDEVKKRIRIKENMGKVDNILELQSELEEKLNRIKSNLGIYETAQSSINDMKKISEDRQPLKISMEKSEVQLSKLNEERRLLKSELDKIENNPEKQDRVSKLKAKISDIDLKIDENNSKYSNILREMREKENLEKSEKENQNNIAKKIKKLSHKQLEKQKVELSSKISKCRFAVNRLMQGYSYDSVELALKDWEDRTLTGKDTAISKVSGKNKEVKKDGKMDLDELSDKIIKNAEGLTRGGDENSLVEVSKFAQKHPRIAKITNWVKSKWNKFRNKDEKEEKTKDKEEPSKTSKETHEDFVNYMREVAEKGLKTAKKEKLEEKMQQNRKQAYDREKEKFGKDYAEMSYKNHERGENELGD